MEKRYRITCQTDPYHAGRSSRHHDKVILKYDGATPVKWVHEDNGGEGLTLDQARRTLLGYAREDTCCKTGSRNYRFFDNSYDDDIWSYRIEPFQVEDFLCLSRETRKEVTTSLLLPSGTVVASGRLDWFSMDIIVHGEVKVYFRGEAYKDVSQFPEELVTILKENGENHPEVELGMNNWYESVIKKDEDGTVVASEVIDLELDRMSDDQLETLVRDSIYACETHLFLL